MARSPINVNGNTLYPSPGGLLNDQLIYRPEYGGGGLLDNGADFQNVRTNFAGGILNGAQYNPATNTFQPIAPSGEFTGTPPDGMTQPTGEAGGDGVFTLSDLMDFQQALDQGNFGETDPVSIFRSFEDKGKGTYDIASNSGGGTNLTNLFYGTTANGEYVPMNQAEYKLGGRKGEVIDPQLVKNTILGRLRRFDNSGGMDGGGENDGPDNDGSGGSGEAAGSSSDNDGNDNDGNDSTGGDGPSI